jgi:hypothetical protein
MSLPNHAALKETLTPPLCRKNGMDEKGNLTNEETRRLIGQLPEELVRWTKKLAGKTWKSQYNAFQSSSLKNC